MNKIIEELKPQYDRAKSFYGKAETMRQDNKIILISYKIKILELDTKTEKITFLTHNENHLTQTTNRHINEFLQQFTNENKKSKSELLRLMGV